MLNYLIMLNPGYPSDGSIVVSCLKSASFWSRIGLEIDVFECFGLRAEVLHQNDPSRSEGNWNVQEKNLYVDRTVSSESLFYPTDVERSRARSFVIRQPFWTTKGRSEWPVLQTNQPSEERSGQNFRAHTGNHSINLRVSQSPSRTSGHTLRSQGWPSKRMSLAHSSTEIRPIVDPSETDFRTSKDKLLTTVKSPSTNFLSTNHVSAIVQMEGFTSR